jgi:plastocyanin
MNSQIRMTFVVVMMLAAMACGKASSPMSPTPTSMSVTIVSGAFMPNPISISVGATVTWTNKDSVAHAIVADGSLFSSGTIAPGNQYSYTFRSAGTFTYHDTTNPGMAGSVAVSGTSQPGY